jgi:magnesium-protoporphyrin O-methyltransferase
VVAPCCDPEGYEAVFGRRFAHRSARRYRRRGLTRAERRIVGYLSEHGLQDSTVLEIGGGVGGIHVELLRRGARSAVNLELVGTYEAEAAEIIEEAHLTDRVTRRWVDIAEHPEAVEPADIVVMHRVVCCYPDYERLLNAAASHARHHLVFTHPPRNVATRSFLWVQNRVLALMGTSFRAFVHPPADMIATVQRNGFETSYQHGYIWRVVAMQRRT